MESCAPDIAFVHHLAGHGSQLLNKLHDQWRQQKYCDLIISARGRSLPVHACVMSAFSPRIASLIAKKSHIYDYSPLVTVKVRYTYSVMESIVSALYTGVFQPATRLLKEIGMASEFLQIKELIQIIMQHVNNQEQQIQLSASFTSSESKQNEQTFTVPRLMLYSEGPELKVNSDSSQNSGKRNVPEREFPLCLRRDSTEKHSNSLKNLVIKITHLDLSAFEQSSETENTANLDISLNTKDMPQLSDIKQEIIENEIVGASKSQFSATNKKSPAHNELYINNTLDAKRVRKSKISSIVSKNDKKKSVAPDVAASESIIETASNRNSLDSGVVDSRPQTSDTDSVGTHQASPAEGPQGLESTLIEEICPDDPVREELSQLLSNSSGIKCSKCSIKFTDLDYYQSHIQNHPTIDCDQCGQWFFNRFALGKHLRRVHLGFEYLVCRHCGLRAKSQVELRQHCAEVHNDSKPFACTYKDCKFTTKKHSALMHHIIIHKDTKEYMCDKCSMSFLRPLGLISHQRACYQLQQFLCDLCGQSFNHSQSMRKHRQSMHFGEKPFKCSVCLNSFSDHRNLSRHMRIHNNIFPYACTICQQRFRHSNSLKAHVNSKHQGIPKKNQLKLKKDTQKAQSVSNFKHIMNQEENIPKSKKKLQEKLAQSMKALQDTQ